MQESANEQSVRESSRRASIAIAVVQEHTGPIKKIISLTRKHPWPALAIALVAGILSGLAFRRR